MADFDFTQLKGRMAQAGKGGHVELSDLERNALITNAMDGGSVDPEEVQELIDESLEGYYNKFEVDSSLNTKSDKSDTYTKSEVNALIPSVDNDTIIGTLPSSGVPNTIYRVPGTNSYTDYAWDGTQFVALGTFTGNGDIDATPTENSTKLVQSGGVYEEIHGEDEVVYAVGTYNSWTANRYLVVDTGALNTSSQFSVTGFIDIHKYNQIKTSVNQDTVSRNAGNICFYNAQQQFINTTIVGNVASQAGLYDVVANVPNGAVYARFCLYTTNITGWYLTGVVKSADYLEKETIDASVSYIESSQMVTGKLRSASGTLVTASIGMYTTPIAVFLGAHIKLSCADISTTYAFITRVDSEGNFINVVQAGLSDSSQLKDYDVTLDFDGYISISCRTLSAKLVKIISAGMYDVVSGTLTSINSKVSELGESISDISDIVSPEPLQLTSDNTTDNYYWSIGGNLASLNGYLYSDPIRVTKGCKVTTTEAVNEASAVSVVSKVTSDNSYISTLVAGNSTSTTYNYEIQEDCYISISAYDSIKPFFRVVYPNVEEKIEIISDNAITTDSTTKLLGIGTNPLKTILRECGYGCLLKTWGFIGDSYTSGETPAYDGSTLKMFDCYKWSWGQQFMKIIGSEGYNFSNGGQTAKGWIRSQGTVHDETYYGGVGGGDWRLAQTELKQGYIISLGINDNGYFGQTYLGATYTLGNVSTDVNTEDYTQNNENTFAGCYAGIIQRILSVQPKAKIFCITQFQDTLENVNGVVRDIVALFPNNVFLIDLHNYALNIVNESYYMSNGHPSPLGYAYMAYCINTYVDWIIRNYKQKFMDVTLIGSNYTLTAS